MAEKIYVTPEELRGSAKKVQDNIDEYEKLYNKLYQEIEGMTNSWKGQANNKLVERIEGFKPEFDNLRNVLKSYVNTLLKAADIYDSTEEAIKNAASKLTTGR